ncbi:MAG: nucleotidyltransferase family protein, partial [Thermoleophilia bacterium]|nr:nucleotidyltransferase family protein [Thermoleophilia bacterium]
AGISNPLIVLGSDHEAILKIIRGHKVSHCYNENYRNGMLSSVQCGLASLADRRSAALIIPGDQPMIDAAQMKRVMKAWHESGKGIVMPVHNGKRGHPLIVDMKYKPEVMSLPESKGLRALAEQHPDDVMEVETDDPAVLRDIDTHQDYLGELNLINRYGRDNPVQTEQQGDGAGN